VKCACCADARVSTERELCPSCAQHCFPVVNGQRTDSSEAHRASVHARVRTQRAEEARRAERAAAGARASEAQVTTLKEAALKAGRVFLREAEKELIPNLVRLAEREAKKRIGGL